MPKSGDIRALIVDDSEADAILLHRALRDAGLSVATTRVDTAQALRLAFAGQGWDIVLCDYVMPVLDVAQVLELVRELAPAVPVVLVSGTVGEEAVADLMRRGIADVVLKDHLSPRLGPVLLREITRARERSSAEAGRQRTAAVLHAFNVAQDWREAMEASLRHLGRGFGCAVAVMWELSGPDMILTPIASWAAPAFERLNTMLHTWRRPARTTLVGRAMLRGEALTVRRLADHGDDPELAAMVADVTGLGITGFVCHPLAAGGRQFTMSILFADQDAAFDDVLSDLAATAAALQPALFRKLIEYERNMLRDALDAARCGVLITDAEIDPPGPRVVYANRAAGEMTGYEPAQLLGLTPRCLQGAATDRAALDRVRRALVAAEPVCVEVTNYRRDGTPFLVELEISPVRDQGQVAQFIAVQSDITQRRRMEAAQRAAEEDLQAVVRFGPGLLYRGRVALGQIQLVGVYGDNCRIGAILGEQGDGGAAVEALLNEPDCARVLHALAAEAGRADATVDLPMARPGLLVRWLRNAVRVTQRVADFVEFVGYLSDVTVEKEEQLRMQKLTTLITLGEMATGMAHELNQPLSSISFAAQNAALHLGRESPDLRAIVGKITKIAAEADRAARLIEHMRVFARNERQTLTPISWHAALRDALEIMAPRLRGYDIVTELPADLPDVLGSAIPMEQMLINLLGNAMDAYETEGAPAVSGTRVVIVSGGVADGMVMLRVADRAGGIPPNVLPRVFEPFFSTKAPGKGTGLGLALCFGTVTEMAGTLTVHNQDGGAVFEIRLPAAPAAALPFAMTTAEG